MQLWVSPSQLRTLCLFSQSWAVPWFPSRALSSRSWSCWGWQVTLALQQPGHIWDVGTSISRLLGITQICKCICICINVCQSARTKKLDLINTQKYMQHAHAFDIWYLMSAVPNHSCTWYGQLCPKKSHLVHSGGGYQQGYITTQLHAWPTEKRIEPLPPVHISAALAITSHKHTIKRAMENAVLAPCPSNSSSRAVGKYGPSGNVHFV